MPVSVVVGDLTRLPVDAIVNAANTALAPGGGVCGAIFAAAGYGELDPGLPGHRGLSHRAGGAHAGLCPSGQVYHPHCGTHLARGQPGGGKAAPQLL